MASAQAAAKHFPASRDLNLLTAFPGRTGGAAPKFPVARHKYRRYIGAVSRPNFFVFENNSKGVVLALPFEAHTIQAVVTRKGFLNYFKLREVEPDALKVWTRRNIQPLSQIAWFAYDQGRYRERTVATNLVRELEIDIDKFAGWAFV